MRVRVCPVRLVIAAVPDLLARHTIHASFVLHKPQLTGAHAVHLHIRGGGPAPDHVHEVRLPAAALPEIFTCRAFHPTSASDDHVPKTHAAEVVHDAAEAAVVLRYRAPRTALLRRGFVWGRGGEGGIRMAVHPRPPQTKGAIVGKQRNLPLGKSDQAVFDTHTFASQTPSSTALAWGSPHRVEACGYAARGAGACWGTGAARVASMSRWHLQCIGFYDWHRWSRAGLSVLPFKSTADFIHSGRGRTGLG